MTIRSINEDDSLDDFTARTVTLNDVTKTVYVTGSGPEVIVIAEIPGISHGSHALQINCLLRTQHWRKKSLIGHLSLASQPTTKQV